MATSIFEPFSEAAARVSADIGGVTVIVSHRMSTARLADRIVVIDKGRLFEYGTHEKLVAQSGGTSSCSSCRPRGTSEPGVSTDGRLGAPGQWWRVGDRPRRVSA